MAERCPLPVPPQLRQQPYAVSYFEIKSGLPCQIAKIHIFIDFRNIDHVFKQDLKSLKSEKIWIVLQSLDEIPMNNLEING